MRSGPRPRLLGAPGAARAVTTVAVLLAVVPAACTGGSAAAAPTTTPVPAPTPPTGSGPTTTPARATTPWAPARPPASPTATPTTTPSAGRPSTLPSAGRDPYANRVPPPGSVLARLPRSPAGPASAAGLRRVLAPLDRAPAVAPRSGYLVADPWTGAVRFSAGGARAVTPASTLKLLTSTAVLDRWGAGHRFATRVVLAGASAGVAHLVLVGGGDPSLTSVGGAVAATAPVASTAVTGPARLPGLAALTVRALRAQGVRRVTLRVDDTLFAGPAVNPAWPRRDVPEGFVAPVDALSVDNGRVRPGSAVRVADPARSAGAVFAGMLRVDGITVAGGVTRTRAPAAARVLAAVSSPTLAALLRHLLQASDNDYAETLLRQVAVGTSVPASSVGASRAVRARLTALGIDLAGTVQDDGSGLAHGDRVRPVTLAAVIRRDLWTPRLSAVVTGLPVAGRSGSLLDRMGGSRGAAAGRVVAKTGTLTGVHALAGYVVPRSADPVVFVLMVAGAADDEDAEERLDDAAVGLARCGCHS